MIAPGMFPMGDNQRRIAGYDLEANRFIAPPHVRAMPWADQVEWAKSRDMRPTADTAALHRSRTFMEQAREILEAVKRGHPGAEGLMAAYSMFEMMQPFSTTDDVTVNVAAETAMTNDEYLALPANFFSFPGKTCWFRCMGKMSNVVTTPGTATAKVRYSTPVAGGGIAGTQLTISGLLTPNPVAVTDNLWWMDTFVKALVTGKTTAALTLLAWGYIYFANALLPTTQAQWQSCFMPPGGTSLANITGLDNTVSKALTATITPSLTTLTWTVRDAWIVAMN